MYDRTRATNNTPASRVVARYLEGSVPESVAKSHAFIEKLIETTEKDLKKFVADLPSEIDPWERITVKVAPAKKFAEYLRGYLFFTAGVKGSKPKSVDLRIEVVVVLKDGVVVVKAYSGNRVLKPLTGRGTEKDALDRIKKILMFFKDTLKDYAAKTKPIPKGKEIWSVVTEIGDRLHASEIEYFNSENEAQEYAKKHGDCYVVQGTQEWDERLGQTKESDTDAFYVYVR